MGDARFVQEGGVALREVLADRDVFDVDNRTKGDADLCRHKDMLLSEFPAHLASNEVRGMTEDVVEIGEGLGIGAQRREALAEASNPLAGSVEGPIRTLWIVEAIRPAAVFTGREGEGRTRPAYAPDEIGQSEGAGNKAPCGRDDRTHRIKGLGIAENVGRRLVVQLRVAAKEP